MQSLSRNRAADPDSETQLAHIRAVAASTLAVWPEARAAVLFGSRARGDHQPDSDWDVAFITTGDGDDVQAVPEDLPISGLQPDVQCLAVPECLLVRKCAAIGHVVRGVVRDGQLLAGSWNRPETEGLLSTMQPDEYVQAIDNATASMRDAALEAGRIGSTPRWDFDRGACNRFAATSANAAEHLAKAMLGRYGIDHKFAHDLNLLANQAGDAGFEGLASAIRSLNGLTKAHHVARYGGLDADGCRYAVRRFLAMMKALGNELPTAADYPELSDAAHDLSVETSFRADEGAAALRASAARAPAPEAPAPVRELIRVLTDARPDLARALEDLTSSLRDEGDEPPPPPSSSGFGM